MIRIIRTSTIYMDSWVPRIVWEFHNVWRMVTLKSSAYRWYYYRPSRSRNNYDDIFLVSTDVTDSQPDRFVLSFTWMHTKDVISLFVIKLVICRSMCFLIIFEHHLKELRFVITNWRQNFSRGHLLSNTQACVIHHTIYIRQFATIVYSDAGLFIS